MKVTPEYCYVVPLSATQHNWSLRIEIFWLSDLDYNPSAAKGEIDRVKWCFSLLKDNDCVATSCQLRQKDGFVTAQFLTVQSIGQSELWDMLEEAWLELQADLSPTDSKLLTKDLDSFSIEQLKTELLSLA